MKEGKPISTIEDDFHDIPNIMSEFFIKLEEFIDCTLDKERSNEYNEKVLFERDLSSAGRASALQAEGHRFEP
ncbi:MAG: hypothetical protein K0R34_1483, partial [Herbinix sp.]|nr:hypothetical protein [Herbinix sp.]